MDLRCCLIQSCPEKNEERRREEEERQMAAPSDPRSGVKDCARTGCESPSACSLSRFSFLMTWGWS